MNHSGSLIAIGVFCSTAAFADGLDLEGYVRQVERSNPELAAARARSESQLHRVRPAGSPDDPFIAVGPDEIPFGGMGYVIRYQASQNIPFPGKLAARESAALSRARSVRENESTRARELRVLATQMFFQVLFNQKAFELNRKNTTVLEDAVKSARARYESGSGSHHEWLLASIELNGLHTERLRLEREGRILATRLNELRNQPPDEPTGLLTNDFASAISESGVTVTAAIAKQPELRSLTAQVNVAAQEQRNSRLGYLPDFTLQGMVMQSKHAEEPSNWGVMLGMTVPLFGWRKQSDLVAAAAHDQAAAAADVSAINNRLQTEWLNARQLRKTAWDTVTFYLETVLPTTEMAVKASQAAYTARTAPLGEYLAVLRVAQVQELELLGAQIDTVLADLRLRELLTAPPQVRFAPPVPTLFGAGAMTTEPMNTMEAPGTTGMGRGIPPPQTGGSKPGVPSSNGGMKGM